VTGARDVQISADPELLRIALGNLVRNALGHCRESLPVLVSVSRRNGSASIRIQDRGPGVPVSERDMIFEPGGRGNEWATPGHGLGLFIARRIAEAHGGTVRLAGSAQGADFRLELPVAAGRGEACAS
jgi:signal transduction histidine kinase